MRRVRRVLTVPLTLLLASGFAPPQKNRINPDAQTMVDFVKNVDTYVALHKKLEATLPPLPKQTDPTEVDQHQRALARLIQLERRSARPGDLFTAPMQSLVRRLLRPVFRGRDGTHIRKEILDNEYKGSVVVQVNARYPDEVPVSTMPPQVLKALPKLPEDLEYRFVRQYLILFDPHAHIIADYVEHAFQ
jgi:hypothetical protein